MRKIREMPYVRFHSNTFDLEIERFESGEDVLLFLHDILDGVAVVDKYGETLQLRSTKDKIDFLNSLRENKLFYGMLISKFSKREMNIFELLFTL